VSLPISGQTRLSQVLDASPRAVEYLVSLNPHDFERLRNPVMRRYMASRISLKRVAAMAGVSEAALLHGLANQGDGLRIAAEAAPGEAPPATPHARPGWLAEVDQSRLHWVDELPVDDVQGDPFPSISLAVRQLAPGRVLGIRHRWEPQPLYDVWSKMHLEWFAEPAGPDAWRIFVHRPPAVASFPSKPVIGAEVGPLPAAERAPRIVSLVQQLEAGQTLEVSGLPPAEAESVAAAVRARLGHTVSWEPQPPGAKGVVVRLRRA
jgi:uncharacterized protein (DUF2249 family)